MQPLRFFFQKCGIEPKYNPQVTFCPISMSRNFPISSRPEPSKSYQKAKNIGNFTTPLKPHNIGTHLEGIETSFQVVPLFFKSFQFLVSYITF
jgi:hypothetical protein